MLSSVQMRCVWKGHGYVQRAGRDGGLGSGRGVRDLGVSDVQEGTSVHREGQVD